MINPPEEDDIVSAEGSSVLLQLPEGSGPENKNVNGFPSTASGVFGHWLSSSPSSAVHFPSRPLSPRGLGKSCISFKPRLASFFKRHLVSLIH